jgi:hypothetical protein
VVLEMKSSAAGYLGRRLAEEGAFLARGKHAAIVTSRPEDAPIVSDSFMSQEISRSEGSVADLQRSLDGIEERRRQTVDDLVSAHKFAALTGLADGSSVSSALIARVPGQENSIYVAPSGIHYLEVSRSIIQMKELPGERARLALLEAHALTAHILSRIPAANCVFLAQPPHATALSLRAFYEGNAGLLGLAEEHQDLMARMLGLGEDAVCMTGLSPLAPPPGPPRTISPSACLSVFPSPPPSLPLPHNLLLLPGAGGRFCHRGRCHRGPRR